MRLCLGLFRCMNISHFHLKRGKSCQNKMIFKQHRFFLFIFCSGKLNVIALKKTSIHAYEFLGRCITCHCTPTEEKCFSFFITQIHKFVTGLEESQFLHYNCTTGQEARLQDCQIVTSSACKSKRAARLNCKNSPKGKNIDLIHNTSFSL